LGATAAGFFAGCLGGEGTNRDGDGSNGDSNGEEATFEVPETPEDVSLDERWSASLDTNMAQTSNYDTAVHDDALVIANRAGVTALETGSGEVRWNYNEVTSFDGLYSGDKKVYAAKRADEGEVLALDAEGGDVEWRTSYDRREDAFYPGGTMSGYVVIGGEDGFVIFDEETGEEVSQIDRMSASGSGPIESWDGKIVITASNGSGTELYDPENGSRTRALDTEVSPETVFEGTVVGTERSAFSDGYSIVGVDIETEERLWEVEAGMEFVSLQTAVGDGNMLVLDSFNDKIALSVDIEEGELNWQKGLDVRDPLDPELVGPAAIFEVEEGVAAFDLEEGDRLATIEDSGRGIAAESTDKALFLCSTEVVAYDA
jgi:outer membrane protein assembly factor BamB